MILYILHRHRPIITPILAGLHWLTVRFRIILKILFLTYEALNGLAPCYIRDLLRYENSVRELRSSNNYLLYEPVTIQKTHGDSRTKTMEQITVKY